MRASNLIGQKFVHLRPVARLRFGGRVYWKCACDNCGGTLNVRTDHLLAGNADSCGCIRG